MAQLRAQKDRFEQAGARVVLVGLGSVQEAEAFRKRFDVPFPIVADPRRRLYRAFELRRMAPWDFLSPTVALKGISAMAQGHHVGLPTGDVRQLPGVFIFDTSGRILFSHLSRDPSDHPSPETLLAVLDAVGKTEN